MEEKDPGLNRVASLLGAFGSFGFFEAHTPHFPPSFLQCLHAEQFLQALHGSAPVQVAAVVAMGEHTSPSETAQNRRDFIGTRLSFHPLWSITNSVEGAVSARAVIL